MSNRDVCFLCLVQQVDRWSQARNARFENVTPVFPYEITTVKPTRASKNGVGEDPEAKQKGLRKKISHFVQSRTHPQTQEEGDSAPNRSEAESTRDSSIAPQPTHI